MLKQTFIKLCSNFSNDTLLIESLWVEIRTHYTNSKRHYHNLLHIENILNELISVKDKIKDWNAILFSMYYHDYIYSATKNNNEELSAEFAKDSLERISVPKIMIEKCYNQIIATKSHSKNSDNDTNIFIDADLSILGASWEQYLIYTKQIRTEYSIYPTFIYNKGRKKVIKHFLEMEAIFKTKSFSEKYEEIAKCNLNKELKILDS